MNWAELKPYQQTLMDKLQAGGFKPGEMSIISAGRQTGKSMYYSYAYDALKNRSMTPPAKFTILDQAEVDGETWYTISCTKEVSTWLREQSQELQHSHIDTNRYLFVTKFDIHEKLYTLMALSWT